MERPSPFIGAGLRPLYPPDAVENPPDLPREELLRLAREVRSRRYPPGAPSWAPLWRAYPVRADVPWRHTPEGTVEFMPGGQGPLTLDGVGAFVWVRLSGERTLDDIAGDIGRDFNAEEEVIREDLYWLMQQLMQRQLVVFQGESTCR
ncbi:PqqD family protein [Corallococcus sp. BB11-1]|uniref:PqqD family protein n=1 Tax=Corallococcus sp. BB11-1 TaxID=2996783 RepID=UPI0022716A65|nr:PqqD family protein [Corallococcus sp. BB11-1]MCY1034361.1 PqqD family protein [Corallococcus sp. BB11-1]